jgi:hypothetical protein
LGNVVASTHRNRLPICSSLYTRPALSIALVRRVFH